MDTSTLLENLRGAGEIAFHVVTPWRRRYRTTWGATTREVGANLPGDELVTDLSWGYTHAVTIDAPPAAVWPWLAQLGQGRGGLYSFELLENLVGCRMRNSDRVLPALQSIAVGDEIQLHPKAPPLVVAIAKPERCLALVGGRTGDDERSISLWAFHLTETDRGATRLIERGRYAIGRTTAERWSMGPTILEPISFVMSRQMLRTIRRSAERRVSEITMTNGS